jgi:uncharacterized protein (TIRG00374 family)
MSGKLKSFLKYILSFIILVVSVWYAVRDINIYELKDVIFDADYLWVLLSVPIILLSHWVRAARWKTMLNPIKETKSVFNLFSAVMIGYFFNCVLPRGGEFIRPYVVARREKISYSATFATVIAERVIDVLMLGFIFFVAFFFLGSQILKALPSEVNSEKVFVLALIVIGVMFLSFYPPIFRLILKYTLKPISQNAYDKISELFEKFLKGFTFIKCPSQYLRLTTESMLIWVLYTIPMFMMFYAFDFQARFDLGFDAAVVLIIVSGIGVSIAPSPGAIGVYHVLIQTALHELYGIDKTEALAYATLTHGINYLIQVVTGGIFAMRENVKKLPDSADISAIKNTGQG